VVSESIIELNELNFEADVLGGAGLVLVDFTAAWCPPCRALAPILARFAAREKDRVVVGSVDADANPDLAARYRVRGLPTVIVFAGGKEVARRVGLTTEDGLRALCGASFAARAG
jgi:thioredoxin